MKRKSQARTRRWGRGRGTCRYCWREFAIRSPRGGDGSATLPAFHRYKGVRCPGTLWDVAEARHE